MWRMCFEEGARGRRQDEGRKVKESGAGANALRGVPGRYRRPARLLTTPKRQQASFSRSAFDASPLGLCPLSPSSQNRPGTRGLFSVSALGSSGSFDAVFSLFPSLPSVQKRRAAAQAPYADCRRRVADGGGGHELGLNRRQRSKRSTPDSEGGIGSGSGWTDAGSLDERRAADRAKPRLPVGAMRTRAAPIVVCRGGAVQASGTLALRRAASRRYA